MVKSFKDLESKSKLDGSSEYFKKNLKTRQHLFILHLTRQKMASEVQMIHYKKFQGPN